MYEFTVYKDVPVEVALKYRNQDPKGPKGVQKYYGDVPVARYNKVTKQFEHVVNPRGNAYAKRNDVRYRKRKEK